MPTALAISPHLDDAVFSAGGTLAGLARDGWRVVVATVFTASVAEPKGFALACQLDKGLPPEIDYMALRRDEDAAACAAIGGEPHWLPFREAPHRGYDSAAALFAGLHDGDGIIETIAPVLAKLVLDLAPDLLLSPQGIGAHVDHIAVYRALRAVEGSRWFWADFPYAFRADLRPSPFSGDWAELDARPRALPPADVAAKIEASLAYESQLSFQFGGKDAARTLIATAGQVERFAASPRTPLPAAAGGLDMAPWR